MDNDTDRLTVLEVVTKTIFGEASNQKYIGQQAVANVIANRVKLNIWMGHDFRQVCLKPYQFSCWLKSDPNRARIMAATETDFTYNQCHSIAALAIAGNLPDITGGADSYKVVGTPAKWAEKLTPVAHIGQHEFYITV